MSHLGSPPMVGRESGALFSTRPAVIGVERQRSRGVGCERIDRQNELCVRGKRR